MRKIGKRRRLPVKAETTLDVRDFTAVEYGGEIFGVVETDGHRWISVRNICTRLGLSLMAQYRKLQGDGNYTCSLIATRDSKGKIAKLLCLDLDHLMRWLWDIQSARLSPEIAERLERYKSGLFNAAIQQLRGRDQLVRQESGLTEEGVARVVRREVTAAVQPVLRRNVELGAVVDETFASDARSRRELRELNEERIQGYAHNVKLGTAVDIEQPHHFLGLNPEVTSGEIAEVLGVSAIEFNRQMVAWGYMVRKAPTPTATYEIIWPAKAYYNALGTGPEDRLGCTVPMKIPHPNKKIEATVKHVWKWTTRGARWACSKWLETKALEAKEIQDHEEETAEPIDWFTE